MIKSFQHKGLKRFFETGSKAGIQAAHAPRLGRQLQALDVATVPIEMNVPGWAFHPLLGKETGRYAVSVSGNWRLTFEFEGSNAVLVHYEDYH